ncbi:MAG TPA: tetratricopeptide repeat protein [Pelomicrobium sp.]|nr:tetratricopeptide repeat protein [Pelomicrobium sp.]
MIRLILTVIAVVAAAAAHADELTDRAEAALKISDPKEMVRQLERELNWGNVVAGYELGVLYRDGKELKQDDERALELFEEAGTPWVARNWHKLGVPRAQYAAGMMILEGRGTEKDTEAAAKWIERAADQGHTKAQLEIAKLYASPEAPNDPERAFFWAALVENKFDLDREEKELAGQLKEQAAAKLGSPKVEELTAAVENWSPRRMAAGW